MIKGIAALAALVLIASIATPAFAVKGTDFIVIIHSPGEKIDVNRCSLKFYDESAQLMWTHTVTSELIGKTFKINWDVDGATSVSVLCVDTDMNMGDIQNFPVKEKGVNALKYTGFN